MVTGWWQVHFKNLILFQQKENRRISPKTAGTRINWRFPVSLFQIRLKTFVCKPTLPCETHTTHRYPHEGKNLTSTRDPRPGRFFSSTAKFPRKLYCVALWLCFRWMSNFSFTETYSTLVALSCCLIRIFTTYTNPVQYTAVQTKWLHVTLHFGLVWDETRTGMFSSAFKSNWNCA